MKVIKLLLIFLFMSNIVEATMVLRKETNYIIIHHSGMDHKKYPNETAETIKYDHIKVKGYFECGYHYIINPDGVVTAGRTLEYIGAHAKAGGRNRDSIGICLIGKDEYFPKQLVSLKNLISHLKVMYVDVLIQFYHSKSPSRRIKYEIVKLFGLDLPF